tara:strand:+ start:75328 stop:75474 length:147 start_codon:yes stop_codon:yes gene_type:complete
MKRRNEKKQRVVFAQSLFVGAIVCVACQVRGRALAILLHCALQNERAG